MCKLLKKFKKTMIAGALVLAQTVTMGILMPTLVHASNGGFHVSGTTLYDANGQKFVMRGINHSHCWDKSDTATAIPAIAKTGANTVRIAFSDGQADLGGYDSIDNVKNAISLAEKNNLISVVEIHDTTGKNEFDYLNKAADYWISMKDALIGKESTVILNIGNEWCGNHTSYQWAEGYKNVIPRLRREGIKNTIMVDCAGWGQYPGSIFEKGQEVFNSDPEKNTMFSIHMYEYAGANEDTVRKNIDTVLDKGLALCIGEFGWRHTNGDVNEQAIMDHCQEKGVGYMGWSWKGNGTGYEFLDLSNDWSGNSLTDWGNTLVHGRNGIKATSQICSVFKSVPPIPVDKITVEAESGNLNGVYKSYDRYGYSKDGYVTGFDNDNDYVEVSVNIKTSGEYYINTQYASQYGDKYTTLYVNDKYRGEKLLKQSNEFNDSYLDTVYLNSGENKIKLQSNWGYYDIDNITITKK